MKKYRTGIQKQVLNLIDYGCNVMHLPYVTTEELKKELRKPNETDEQINHRLTQAVYQLKKKGMIKDKGYGKYSFDRDGKRHYRHCSHLIKKDGNHYCPIKKMYVQPDERCIAIEHFDGKKKVDIPKCSGYSTSGNVELSECKLNADKAMWIGNHRFYNGSQHDPESKYYLPNLVARENALV